MKTKIFTLTLALALASTSHAQKDSTDGPVVIDGKRFKVIIYDKGVDTSEKNELKFDPKEPDVVKIDKPFVPKAVITKWNVFELGLNNTLNNNNFEMPNAYANMELEGAKSVNFHWGIIQQGVNLIKGKLRFVYGLGIEYNNYRFKQNVDLVKDSKPLETVINTQHDYSKNKLVTQYITVPLMLNYKSNPKDPDNSFNISAGVQVGYLYGAHQKQKWSDGGKEKRKVKDDYNLSDYRFGYVVNFGYSGFNLYAKYYPTTMFKENRGPELNTVAAGIILSPF
jgi:hypothetical protein